MNRSLWISATAMQNQQLMTDVISNNMANVNTTAYKRSTPRFQDMLYQNQATPGSATFDSNTPVGIQIGTGVRVSSISKVFTQGNLQQTDSKFNFAIQGDGFFNVTLPDGRTAYTRAGDFHLNAEGQVVTSNGYAIEGFPQIDITATDVHVDESGTVSVIVNGINQESGNVQISRFANPEGLNSMGQNLYTETPASGTATLGTPGQNGYGGIAQFYIEKSNVEIVKEMVDMIASQRAYELNSKSIKTADEMLRMVSNLK